MDRKRRKLQSRSSRSSEVESSSQSSRTQADYVNLIGDNPQATITSIRKFKKELSTAQKVESFMTDENASFRALNELFVRCARMKDISNDSPWHTVLKETISVMANFCYLSFDACMEMIKIVKGFSQLCVDLLESGTRLGTEVKVSLLRLISNMCQHKGTTLPIVTNSQLIDRIVFSLISDNDSIDQNSHKLQKYSLKAILMITSLNISFAKAILSSNGCYYLGELLKREYSKDNLNQFIINQIFTTITNTMRSSVKITGRQLASSGCASRLLSIFLDANEKKERKRIVLELCQMSFELREQFKNEDVIERLMELGEGLTEDMVKLLSSYTLDVYGRTALMEKGALDILINKFSQSDSRQQRAVIVNAFRHFIYCSAGSAYLCQSKVYVDTVVRHIIEYLDKYKHQCDQHQPESIDAYHKYASLSTQFESISPAPTLNRTLSSSSLLTTANPISTSPNTSPSRSLYTSSTLNSPSSSFQDILSLWMGDSDKSCDLETDTIQQVDQSKESSDYEKEQEALLDKQIIMDEVFILSWQSHVQFNLPVLITEEILDVFIRYLSESPNMDLKAARALKRIARSENMIERFILLQFHTRVLHTLSRINCRLNRYIERCEYCWERAEYADEILREFALHVDSPLGSALIKDYFKSSNVIHRVKTSIMLVQLIRDEVRQCRMFADYKPIDFLLNYLKDILMSDQFDVIQQETTYRNGPKIFYQIISVLSTIIPSRNLTKFINFSNLNEYHKTYQQLKSNQQCFISDQKRYSVNLPDLIKFVNTDGSLIEALPKHSLISGSEYFKGMFKNAFSERLKGCDTITFDQDVENCSPSEFNKFLHYVCGCRSTNCFSIESANDVVTFLQLSDRYLCSELNDMLLSENGPLTYYMSGKTLHQFLNVSLNIGFGNTQLLNDACCCVLMRYSTQDEVLKSLQQIVRNEIAVNTFIEHLSSFIQRKMIKKRYM